MTVPRVEKPKPLPEGSPEAMEVVEKTREMLERQAKAMLPEDEEPLRVLPGDVLKSVAKHEELNGATVSPETVAQLTRRIPYDELRFAA